MIHAYIPLMQYHAIALTKSCPVEAPQCDEQIFEIERHTSLNIFLYNGWCSAARQVVEETTASKYRSQCLTEQILQCNTQRGASGKA